MVCQLIPILLVFLTKLFRCAAQVHVFLHTDPVRYGNDLHLECSSLQYHPVWHWFEDDKFLFRNTLPASDLNFDKYNVKVIDDNNTQLIIHGFEFVDIGRYLCTNGIYGDVIDLSHESNKFVYIDNSTKSTVLQQESAFGISLTPLVSNVSPLPVCQLEIENNTFPVNISKTLLQGAISSFVFQTIEFKAAFFCMKPVKPFRFVCDIGGIALKRDFEKHCSDLHKRKDETTSLKLLPKTLIVIACLLFICFVGGMFFLVKRSDCSFQSNTYATGESGELLTCSNNLLV